MPYPSSRTASRVALLAYAAFSLAACQDATAPTLESPSAGPTEPASLQPIAFAAARTPEQFDFHEEVQYSFSCGAFEGRAVGAVDAHGTLFFNAQGDEVRLKVHIKPRVTVTNMSTGAMIEDNADYNEHLDLATQVLASTGKYFSIKVKGGPVIRDIGRFVFDRDTDEVLFEAGPHDVGLQPLEPFYCQALS
jgi:hypothetical protein